MLDEEGAVAHLASQGVVGGVCMPCMVVSEDGGQFALQVHRGQVEVQDGVEGLVGEVECGHRRRHGTRHLRYAVVTQVERGECGELCGVDEG